MATFTTTTLPSSRPWTAMAYGAGLFVALGGAVAATSPDGVTWSEHALPASGDWQVCFGGGRFVAVALESSTALTSPDGITWTARTLPTAATWYTLAYGNGHYVTIGADSDIVLVSTDGATWTQHQMASTQFWYTLTYGAGVFCVIGYYSDVAATSTDGVTWTEHTMSSAQPWHQMAYGNDIFAVYGNGTDIVATSPDGVTWSEQVVLPTADNWNRIAYGGGYFMIVGYNGDYGTYAVSSPDAITWTPVTLARDTWNALAYGNQTFVTAAYSTNKAATTAVVPRQRHLDVVPVPVVVSTPALSLDATVPPVVTLHAELFLTQPEDQEIVVTDTPTFIVGLQQDDDSLSYTIEIQYADNNAFTGALTYSAVSVPDAGITFTPDDPVWTTTYWRARLVLGTTEGPWSDAQRFDVNTTVTPSQMTVYWTVSATTAPVHLWHFDPPGAEVGDTVTVYGHGFPATGTVSLGADTLAVQSWQLVAADTDAMATPERSIDAATVDCEHWEIVVTVPEVDPPGGPVVVEA